jgi:hypothetical protein
VMLASLGIHTLCRCPVLLATHMEPASVHTAAPLVTDWPGRIQAWRPQQEAVPQLGRAVHSPKSAPPYLWALARQQSGQLRAPVIDDNDCGPVKGLCGAAKPVAIVFGGQVSVFLSSGGTTSTAVAEGGKARAQRRQRSRQ